MQIRSERHNGAIKILALGMQVRLSDSLWAIMRGAVDCALRRTGLSYKASHAQRKGLGACMEILLV